MKIKAESFQCRLSAFFALFAPLRFHRSFPSAALVAICACSDGSAADIPKAPVPKSPYLPTIYRFADAMLEKGRDTHGPQKTGLFLSALDRGTLAPLTHRPAAPAGVREAERAGAKEGPLTAANPQHDENLLRLLYTLSDLSSKPKYRDAADAELKWFLTNTRSPTTPRLPGGEFLSWDVMKDEQMPQGADAVHEFLRPWMLWDRCFELAPDESRRFALDPKIDHFGRQPGLPGPLPLEGVNLPRVAGFCLRTWAVAYARTKDEQFLTGIRAVLELLEQKRQPATGLLETHAGQSDAWTSSTLSLAIDCDGAAHRVPEPLASRLRSFAARADEDFCILPHDVKNTRGFLTAPGKATGRGADAPTPLWTAQYGVNTTAQIAMLCVSRYDNTGKPGYRTLFLDAADAYLQSPPPDAGDLWPGTFGHAISLEVAAWRHSAMPRYLDRARKLADVAVDKFWGTNALPRASFQSEHYESITGADTLALALVDLHLHILHITAVRCPPNTIDR